MIKSLRTLQLWNIKSALLLTGILVALLAIVAILRQMGPVTKDIVVTPVCTGQQASDFRCWRDHYQQMVLQQSPESALADAQRQYDQNDYIKTVCHQIGHVIGRAAAKKYGDISTAYQHGTDFCASGYYHGVIETVAAEIGREKIVSQINQICASLNKKQDYKLPYYNCVHGLGHGLMAINQNQLFTALENCSHLAGDWEQNSCYSGVFMENIISVMDPDSHAHYIKQDDPIYPCNVVKDQFKPACYNYQTSHMVNVYKYDFSKVFNQCQMAGSYSSGCYSSLGRDVSGYTVTNAEKTRAICLSGPTDDSKKYCIEGAVKDFVWQHRSLEKGKQLCQILGGLRDFCNSTAEAYFALY